MRSKFNCWRTGWAKPLPTPCRFGEPFLGDFGGFSDFSRLTDFSYVLNCVIASKSFGKISVYNSIREREWDREIERDRERDRYIYREREGERER